MSVCIWLTGLPSSGKTTLASKVKKRLLFKGHKVEVLDGDVVREGLCRDLGFSREDRDKNIERVAFVAGLLTRNDVITIASFVSPYRKAREKAKEQINNFFEVYVYCPLHVCMQRDVKGLYKKALANEIKGFTGVDDPYEEPDNPDLVIKTNLYQPDNCADMIVRKVLERL